MIACVNAWKNCLNIYVCKILPIWITWLEHMLARGNEETTKKKKIERPSSRQSGASRSRCEYNAYLTKWQRNSVRLKN